MPYWFETKKKKLPRNKDLRRKLSDKQKDRIRLLYIEGVPIREIARRYKQVSRRMIQFIVFPERDKGHKGKSFYNREKHRIAMKKHRDHKKEVMGLAVSKTVDKSKKLA
jgi:predicted DNA-binding protein YlxM (UPF0122 family)